ncbi:hypothetical protein BKA62DRAFT_834268 [Auriculariales sp. MPI-PUGE-AT-0066]|nr:hypothetical protein BKA62DRAFT_834268 [Auriculariales sp. MPI-PUGE-AT-0066]
MLRSALAFLDSLCRHPSRSLTPEMRLYGVIAPSLFLARLLPSSTASILNVPRWHSLGNTWNINGTGNYIGRDGNYIEAQCPRESAANTSLSDDVILLQRQDRLDSRFPYAEVNLFSHMSGSPAEFRLWLGATSTKTRVSLGLHWPHTIEQQGWDSSHKDFDFGDRGRRGNSRCGVWIDIGFFSSSIPTDTIFENMPIKLSIELVDTSGVIIYNMTGGTATGPTQFGTQTVSISTSGSSTAPEVISSSGPEGGTSTINHGALVAAIVVPIVAAETIIVLLLLWLRHRRRQRSTSTDEDSFINPLPLIKRTQGSSLMLSAQDGGSPGSSAMVREKSARPSTSAVSLNITPTATPQDFDASTFIRSESIPPTEYDADDAVTERSSGKRVVVASSLSRQPPEFNTAVDSNSLIQTEFTDIASRITDEDAALQAFRRGELSTELFHAMRRVGFSPETLLQSLNRVGESTVEQSPVSRPTANGLLAGDDDGASCIAPPRYAVWVPAYFNAPLNPEDRALAAELRQKVIPWAKTPFDRIQDEPDFDEKTLPVVNHDDEEEDVLDIAEPVPEWLELFFDLAWTVTFSGLSGNTPIKGGMTVLSFITFFILAWWLWTAQVIYDTKFYVNDALHRFILLIQFLLFAALAAFTSGFDITVGFKEPEKDAGEQAQAEYVKRAFQSISIIFFITRIVLSLQYIRIIRMAKHRDLSSMYIILGGLHASAVLFIGAYLVTRANPEGQLNNALRIIMWGLAIGIEALAYCLSTAPRGLLTQGSMPARLSTLTTVVIGEGLNGFIGPITAAVKSVGFNTHVAGQVIISGLIIFLVFIIYFQSFRARLAPTEARQKLVVFAHLPIQLFIILLLEGLKSILNILTLTNSEDYFIDLMIGDDVDEYDPAVASVVDAFRKVGIDIIELNNNTVDGNVGWVTPEVFDFDTPENSGVTFEAFELRERLYRDLAAGIQALGKSFDAIDGPTADKISDYINGFQPNNQAANDTATSFSLEIKADAAGGNSDDVDIFPKNLLKLMSSSEDERLAPASWVAPVAGALLIALALVMIFNGLARNRYAWWSICARVLVGVSLCLLGTINVSQEVLKDWTQDWLLPTIAIAYLVLYIVDYVISVFQARALALSKQQLGHIHAYGDAQRRPVSDFHSDSDVTASSDLWKDPYASSFPRFRA